MGKIIRRILLVILLVVFLGSSGSVVYTLVQYRVSAKLYGRLTDSYTAAAEQPAEDSQAYICAPITVDFDALRAENPDVIGWIYCEDTVINYPIVRGEDNDLYLHHSYDGAYSTAGSIFMDCGNSAGFEDANSIIYGHHMKNGSMFATLDNWADQTYYEAHPVMWLLTPEGDYRIDLAAGYTTSAYSETYTIFSGHGEEFNAYLEDALAKSDFTPLVQADESANYVLLSTCAYVFTDARYVLHGMLVPVDSVGGVIPD